MTISNIRFQAILGAFALTVLLGAVFPANVFASDSVWVRVHSTTEDQASRLHLEADLSDYGSFQWGQVSQADLAEIQGAGLSVTIMPNPFELTLGEETFDPLLSGEHLLTHQADPSGDWHLVQFDGPVRPEWLQDLRATGLQVAQPLHPFSYFVWGKDDQISAARSLETVRWSGVMQPEWKVQPHLRNFGRELRPTMALASAHVDIDRLRSDLNQFGQIHEITPLNRHFQIIHMDAPGDFYSSIAALASIYTVQYINQDAGPRGEMSNQSVVGNIDGSGAVFPGYADWLNATGFDGDGVIVGIVDGGTNINHVDLADNIVPCLGTEGSCGGPSSGHGTHVAGGVAGTGVSLETNAAGFLRGQGVAPGASLVVQRYNPFLGGGPGGMVPNGMLRIYKDSAESGALLTNNSWGPTGTPQGYDIPTQQIDFISRDALPGVPGHQPVLAVWSIMNGNGDSSGACAPASQGSPDEAKNLFAVGSTSLQTTGGAQVANIFRVSQNSAHGPACDGRQLPHIVAPGCRTDSTSPATGTTGWGLSCGTSMASPVVSGAVAVWAEKYVDQTGTNPSPALVKAVFTAAAQDLVGNPNADGGTMGHRPDRFQGFGRLDLDQVMNHGLELFTLDQTEVFTAVGENWNISLSAVDPDQPIRIMLAWTDVPGHGLGGSTPAWVNDLDLVVDAGGNTYFGNVIGADGWSATGGDLDDRNNLEGVFLNPAQHQGAVNVTVSAANLQGDALDPYDPSTNRQDFALVCYNCSVSDSTFTLEIEPASASICVPSSGSEEVTIDVQVDAVGDYSGAVDLSASGEPDGVSSLFDPASVEAPGSSVWTLTVDASAQAGVSELQLIGDDGEDSQQLPLSLTLEVPPAAPVPVSPADGTTDVGLQPEFVWQESSGADEYTIQVATDPDFTDLVIEATVTGSTFSASADLDIGTVYYWRVGARDDCGAGDWSEVRQFQTRFDPIAELTPAMLDFEIRTGDSGDETLAIANVGSGLLDWTMDVAPCAGGDSADWLTVAPAAGAVAAGEADTVVVTVDTVGLDIGPHEAELCVTTNQVDASPIAVPVNVEVIDPPPGEVSIDSTTLDYGSVATNLTVTRSIQVSNIAAEGSADLSIDRIAVIAGEPAFALDRSDCPDALPAQDACTVEVRFSPESVTAYSGVLRITADGQSSNISLIGAGVEPDPEIFGDRFEGGQ